MIVNCLNQASHLTIHRTRKLSFPGQVLVNKSEKVSPETIIAEGTLPGGIVFVDVAAGLSLPVDEVSAHLTRNIGERVQEGDLVASCEGTFSRLLRAPADGQLIECYHGNLVMTTEEMVTQIKAEISGVVEKIIPEFGATIATWGCLVQGVWGNNRVGSGVLQSLDSSVERPLQLSDLELVTSGQVIITDSCPSPDIFAKLIAKGIAGLVVNFCPPEMLKILESTEIPVVILQGYSVSTPDAFTMAMFNNQQGKIVTVDAHQRDEFNEGCPEVIIPQTKGDFVEDAPLRGKLAIGQEVRIFSEPSLGQTGIVTEITDTPQTFPSGISDYTASVYLENDEEALVPCKNLVILNRGVRQG